MSKRRFPRTIGTKSLVAQRFSRLGKVLACPYCQYALSNSEIGVRGHLRKHVHDGTLKQEDIMKVTCKILGRNIRHFTE